MVTNKNWFEVDKEGLKQLQVGKPKHYLARELIQNAWDENVKVVKVQLDWKDGVAVISVEDDSKEGFRDLKDAYTLYKETYKRKDPLKRGRFNLGEKQAFSICDKAILTTTKGTIIFNEEGRSEIPEKRIAGSIITVWVKMTKEEFEEIGEVIKSYLVPNHIQFYVNGERIKSPDVYKSFDASLTTEISDGNGLRQTVRKTKVNLYRWPKTQLYEMGIPICELQCDFSIDIQQKVPLNVDRENVPQSYLRDVLSEVLNHTYEDVTTENASQAWIRDAMCDERISKEAVQSVIEKRYGEKVCVADNFDMNSIDEAISNGYKVLQGSEMSKDEWLTLRRFELMPSSSKLFGTSFVGAKSIAPNPNQVLTARYATKIAKRLLDIDIKVEFVTHREMVAAQFNPGLNVLTFNVVQLGNKFFNEPVSVQTTDLILHELGHYAGNHTEDSYHKLITKMGGELVMLALTEPEFFQL